MAADKQREIDTARVYSYVSSAVAVTLWAVNVAQLVWWPRNVSEVRTSAWSPYLLAEGRRGRSVCSLLLNYCCRLYLF